jgi:acyl-CoA thioesterase-1
MALVSDICVLFVGDSHVVGVGDPGGGGWVGRVVAGACDAGIPLTAYNLGVRGDTSADVLVRWQAEARACVEPGADSRVVFCFGVNDATVVNGVQRVALAQSRANLSAVLVEAQGLGLRALLVGPAPAGDEAQQERIAELSSDFAKVAAGHGVPYIDIFGSLRGEPAWTGELADGDGAHPGSGGYALLAGLVMERWLGWLSANDVHEITPRSR